MSEPKRADYLPDLGNEVVDIVPSKSAIRDAAEPT